MANNIYQDQVKDVMIDTGYAKKINPLIKSSKAISDIRFKISSGTLPYSQKYELRHQEIYEDEKALNNLHLPIENGDIFQVLEGKGPGYYILVGQECDLMMRTDPMGSRTRGVRVATLLKIKELTRDQLDAEIAAHSSDVTKKDHFYANKFKLEYFKSGTTDLGLAQFPEVQLVNLDALDACVFNTDGKASFNLKQSFDIDLVSKAWEVRYEKLLKIYGRIAGDFDELFPMIDKMMEAKLNLRIKNMMSIKLAATGELGKGLNYTDGLFDFGIKRVKRLKPEGAKYLLDRYYKHLSRVAESHDFASDYIS